MNVAFRSATERDREIFDWQFINQWDRSRPLVVTVDGVIVLITGRTEPQYVASDATAEFLRALDRVRSAYIRHHQAHADYTGRSTLDPLRRQSGSIGEIFAESLGDDLTPAQQEILRYLENLPPIKRAYGVRRKRGASARGILHNVPSATKHTLAALEQRKRIARRGSLYYPIVTQPPKQIEQR